MPQIIYNSLTRKKEEFIPLQKDKKLVTIYTCGQTVYDDLHIGAARTYSNWDVIVRFLRYCGYEVLHVQNFTDVGHLTSDADTGEDKIVKRAKERQIDPMELVETQIRKYFQDTDSLNITRPNISPRATQHIVEMQQLVKRLLEKGYAYETEDTFYFDVSKFEGYGKMAGFRLEDQQAGARVDVDESKKNPSDFALWIKAPPEHLMKWESPWGVGYPGWHLECSVMSMKYLGDTFDIHGGGIDHLSIHHPNERAQSEAVTGKTFARYWLHSEFLTMKKEKMSKSTGKFITAREAIEEYGAGLLRFFLTQSHYRSQVDFTTNLIELLRPTYMKIITAIQSARLLVATTEKAADKLSDEASKIKEEFITSMKDDFNFPSAWKALHTFTTHINREVDDKNPNLEQLKVDFELYLEILDVMGFIIPEESSEDGLIKLLIDLRRKAREKKDFEQGDYIRDKLKKLGVFLEDKPYGVIYRREIA
ncbi:MAG: cysteine--tRNA ligase [Candidatus Hodarchaeales archaeon]|jgi:cysteinyl-tRNA synthetase